MELRGQKITEAANDVVAWCGSQGRVINCLAISRGTMRAWLRGECDRLSKINHDRLARLYKMAIGEKKKVMGLAYCYADLIYKSAKDESGMTKAEVLDVIRNCSAGADAGRNDFLRLTYVDFRHDRKRFACIVCANIFPQKTKREIWEIVKKAIPGIEVWSDKRA